MLLHRRWCRRAPHLACGDRHTHTCEMNWDTKHTTEHRSVCCRIMALWRWRWLCGNGCVAMAVWRCANCCARSPSQSCWLLHGPCVVMPCVAAAYAHNGALAVHRAAWSGACVCVTHPAYLFAATPVRTMIPAPIMQPIPRSTRSSAPSTLQGQSRNRAVQMRCVASKEGGRTRGHVLRAAQLDAACCCVHLCIAVPLTEMSDMSCIERITKAAGRAGTEGS